MLAPRPNFVLLMADDIGWGDVSYNNVTGRIHNPGAGGQRFVPNPPRTPHLDQMAMGPHSLLFHRFYAGSAVCSPTRASALTGRTSNRECITGAEGCGQEPARTVCGTKVKRAREQLLLAVLGVDDLELLVRQAATDEHVVYAARQHDLVALRHLVPIGAPLSSRDRSNAVRGQTARPGRPLPGARLLARSRDCRCSSDGQQQQWPVRGRHGRGVLGVQTPSWNVREDKQRGTWL